ncbi:transposase [Streptomyces sp. A0592]|nr:transposase [Streptomyces sp. A0592]
MVGRNRSDDSAVRECVSTRSWIVDDDLWALIEPLLPPWPTGSPGPRPVMDRLCLQRVRPARRYRLATPTTELSSGSGQTCWRRLERRQQAGVFDNCTASRSPN